MFHINVYKNSANVIKLLVSILPQKLKVFNKVIILIYLLFLTTKSYFLDYV